MGQKWFGVSVDSLFSVHCVLLHPSTSYTSHYTVTAWLDFVHTAHLTTNHRHTVSSGCFVLLCFFPWHIIWSVCNIMYNNTISLLFKLSTSVLLYMSQVPLTAHSPIWITWSFINRSTFWGSFFLFYQNGCAQLLGRLKSTLGCIWTVLTSCLSL